MKTIRNQWNVLKGFGILLLLLIAMLLALPIPSETDEKKKIAFIMSGSTDEEGWNKANYDGIKAACEKLGVELLVRENVKEFSGACEEAIDGLAGEGAQMIILSSYGYSEEVYDVVSKYPEIAFYGNSSEYHKKNLTSYFMRMYQPRYLSGMIAGLKTETNRIGYVAAMPNNEVNRGISAFTLGVRHVNPEADVVVAWTGSWDDGQKEKELASHLVQEENADILTYHQNRMGVIEAAEEEGVWSIGYQGMAEGASEKHLTAVVCDWEQVYYELIKEFLQGRANSQENFWIGLSQDAVGLAEYSSEVTEEAKEAVEMARAEILGGKAVFSGDIYDTEGNLQCHSDEMIGDERLLEEFNWYADGVEFVEMGNE